jgi:hypothetical protein
MQTFSTSNTDMVAVAAQIKDSLPSNPTLLLYFHSVAFDAATVADTLAKTYPGVPLMGCSTAGEIVTGHMLDGSLVVAAFTPELVQKAEVVRIGGTVKAALETLMAKFDKVDHTTHVGIILLDGLSGKEERIIERLSDYTDLTFVGGSAGDDLKFAKTYVAVNGKIVAGYGALALLQVPAGFDLIKTQSFYPTGKTLTPTRVDKHLTTSWDQTTRAVLEFNGKPAAQAYAEAIGAESVEAATHAFMDAPLGLMAGNEPFVRSPQRIENDTMYFYCSVNEGVELSVLKGTDILTDTRKALAGSRHRGLVVFNCILRTLELKDQGKTEAFGQLFTQSTVGFSTYGEAYIGHINQTATILALR